MPLGESYCCCLVVAVVVKPKLLSLFPSDIDSLMEKTETTFTNVIAKGDRKRGMTELRLPEHQRNHDWVYLRDGWFLGALFPCLVAIIYLLATNPARIEETNFAQVTRIYGGFTAFVIYLWLLGVNFIIWNRYKVNYVFIFEFDPRHHIEIPNYFELVAFFSSLIAYSYFMYLVGVGSPHFPPDYHPAILFGVFMVILFFPFNLFYKKSRIWLLKEFWRIITAPLYKVEFADFFLGDQFCSLVYVLLSVQYTACIYAASGSESVFLCDQHKGGFAIFLAVIPSYFRLLQNFRRYRDLRDKSLLVNAGKYATAMMVPITAGLSRIFGGTPLLVLWLFAAVSSWIYSSIWDIKRDWSLLDRTAPHKFLRQKLAFPYPWVYYVCIPLDIVLRGAFIVTLSENPANPQLRDFFLAVAEIYRRFQWNFFRLENEHLNNAGRFRAVKEVPLPASIATHGSS